MDIRQKVIAALFGVGLLLVIVELVRRRKLKEEYSALWILAGLVIVVVGLNYGLLRLITELIGAGYTSSTIFFFGIFFLLALCLQFSVRISKLENHAKNLAQELAILRARQSEDGSDAGR
jgi:hypothetical protein